MRDKGEKHSPEKAETSQYLNILDYPAVGRKKKAEDDFSRWRMDFVRSQGPVMDIFVK